MVLVTFDAVRVNKVVCKRLPEEIEPFTGTTPTVGEIETLVQFCVLHENVDALLYAIDDGFAVKKIILHGVVVPTVTVMVAVALFVSPIAVSRYVFAEIRGPVETKPDGRAEEMTGLEFCVMRLVMQFSVTHLRVADPPEITEAGTALNEVMVQGSKPSSSAEAENGLIHISAITRTAHKNIFFICALYHIDRFCQIPIFDLQKSLGYKNSKLFCALKFFLRGQATFLNKKTKTMKKGYFFSVMAILCLTATAFFSTPSRAQQTGPTINYQKFFGGSGDDFIYKIMPTSDGGFLFLGKTNSSDGDFPGNYGGYDASIVKTDAEMNMEWSGHYGGNKDEEFRDGTTADFGYIVVGSTTTSNQGDDVVGQHGAAGVSDYWVVKIAFDGTLLEQICLGGDTTDEGHSITRISQTTVMVGGNAMSNKNDDDNTSDVTGNHGGYDAWFATLNAETLELISQKTFGGSGDDYVTDLIYDGTVFCTMTGNTNSLDGDWEGYTSAGTITGTTLRFSANNYLINVRSILSENGNNYINCIEESSNGMYVYGGTSNSNMWSFDLTQDHLSQNWSGENGGSDIDTLIGMCVAEEHMIAVGGTKSSDGDITVNQGGYDFVLIRKNGSGDLIWIKTSGGTGNDIAESIVATGNGSYLVAGSSDSNDGDMSGNKGGVDGCVISYYGGFGTFDENIQSNLSVQIYPNPLSESAMISFNNIQPVEYTVMDVVGRVLAKHKVTENVVTFERNNLPNGVYFFHIVSTNETITEKVIIQ